MGQAAAPGRRGVRAEAPRGPLQGARRQALSRWRPLHGGRSDDDHCAQNPQAHRHRHQRQAPCRLYRALHRQAGLPARVRLRRSPTSSWLRERSRPLAGDQQRVRRCAVPASGGPMQKVTPFLWFDGKAQEAANFYVSVFKNAQDRQPHAHRRRRAVAGGSGHVGHVRDRGTRIHRLQRRPALHVLAGDLPVRAMRDPGRDRRAVGEALRRRRRRSSAAGCRTNMACPGRSFLRSWGASAGQGCREIQAGRWQADDADEQDRHRGA